MIYASVEGHGDFGIQCSLTAAFLSCPGLGNSTVSMIEEMGPRSITTKVGWYGGTLTKAPRNFPSTRRYSRCGHDCKSHGRRDSAHLTA